MLSYYFCAYITFDLFCDTAYNAVSLLFLCNAAGTLKQ